MFSFNYTESCCSKLLKVRHLLKCFAELGSVWIHNYCKHLGSCADIDLMNADLQLGKKMSQKIMKKESSWSLGPWLRRGTVRGTSVFDPSHFSRITFTFGERGSSCWYMPWCSKISCSRKRRLLQRALKDGQYCQVSSYQLCPITALLFVPFPFPAFPTTGSTFSLSHSLLLLFPPPVQPPPSSTAILSAELSHPKLQLLLPV